MSSAGDALRLRAEKKSLPSTGFSSFFGSSSSKWEEARDLFVSAANQYKIDKLFKESGDCFCKAAEMAMKADEKDDAANDFWAASKAYKKGNPEREPLSLGSDAAAVLIVYSLIHSGHRSFAKDDPALQGERTIQASCRPKQGHRDNLPARRRRFSRCTGSL